VAEELKKQGYSVRMLLNSDASRGAIRRVLNDLPKIIDPDQGTLLFYFSGHGFAQSGVNYLATFGAGADDIADEGLSIPEVERLLKAAKPKRQILLIDACRNETAAGVRGASGAVSRRCRIRRGCGSCTRPVRARSATRTRN